MEKEIVIKISQKVYKAIWDKNALGCDIDDIKNIIRNGTPLPKGHGDLIDRNDLSLMTVHLVDGVFLCDAPAIIKADKEGENEADS